MKISHGTRIANINPTNGYGYATDRMIASLTHLGHEVQQNWDEAPVEIWFDQPQFWKIDPDKYTIGYHPWESTKLKPGWVDIMNRCDEIWTPSPLIAEWYKADGVEVPIYVYEHGVDPIWKPKRRTADGTLKFLHVGAEALRKGGLETMRSFRGALHGRDASLTMKMINPGFNIPAIGKVEIMNRTVDLERLIDLYHEHHVFVYPSWGEGFGLTPLQAMATGMPVISPWEWAPYAKYMDPRLRVGAVLKDSPWPKVHPGKMFRPSHTDLMDRLKWVIDNYEEAQKFALSKVPDILADYDWISLTNDAFSRLEKRL